MDGAILLWLQENLRTPFLSRILIFITHLGDSGAIWIAAAVLLLISKKYRKAGLSAAIALLLSLLITNLLLKNGIARVRPYEVIPGLTILINPPLDWSFPSGHTSASFAAMLPILRLLPKRYGIPALLLAILIAFSRLYIGVHYPTDVLGGMLVGLFCGWAAIRIVYCIKRK